jgi:feruloyl-CoA synthase
MSPVRAIPYGSSGVERIVGPGGVELVRNREPLGAYPERMTDHLERWASEAPDRVFLGERVGETWRTVSFAETLRAVRSLAQALVDRGLDANRGVAILSENGIDHGLLGLAAQFAGVPYSPISPSYSLVSKDFAKLRDVLGTFEPGLVYVDDGLRYEAAVSAVVPRDVELVVSHSPGGHPFVSTFADLASTTPGESLERAHAAVGAATIAKVLFTSGTTGSPKGVTCAQRMLCSNARMFGQMFPVVQNEPPTILDWLPWNHTFGGNHNFGIALTYGGSLYVNDGKPTPALAERTRANLHDIAPTIYFDVPKGYEILARFLREDEALLQRFFSRLDIIFYSGAGLSRHIWDELQALARHVRGQDILITTSLGSTETGPMALAAPEPTDGPGYVGVPVPGTDVKLVPNGEKLELRLRGPSITESYWGAPDLTRDAFDDEGFYRIGDALRYADPADPTRGFLFDGRISEDFKLDTGTWVSTGPLRLRALAHFAPLISDVVVSGADRKQLALLAFPDIARCRAAATDVPADAPPSDVFASPLLRAALGNALDGFAETSTGSATRIERLVVLDHPPSLDGGEITDKGSLNVRTILARRASIVDDAHADVPPPHVIAARGRVAQR